MKKIKYLIFTLIFISLSVSYVSASCTSEELSKLKAEASKIKVTYKHLGKIEYEDGDVTYSLFDVTMKNIPDNFYIKIPKLTATFEPTNGTAVAKINTGKWQLEVYSNKCEEMVGVINVELPKFNTYSLDPLCEGIDESEVPLCGKYYEYDVSYERFKETVSAYRDNHMINNEETDDEKENFSKVFNKISKFIVKYKLYFITFSIIIILTPIIIKLFKKKKKRGVLE